MIEKLDRLVEDMSGLNSKLIHRDPAKVIYSSSWPSADKRAS